MVASATTTPSAASMAQRPWTLNLNLWFECSAPGHAGGGLGDDHAQRGEHGPAAVDELRLPEALQAEHLRGPVTACRIVVGTGVAA